MLRWRHVTQWRDCDRVHNHPGFCQFDSWTEGWKWLVYNKLFCVNDSSFFFSWALQTHYRIIKMRRRFADDSLSHPKICTCLCCCCCYWHVWLFNFCPSTWRQIISKPIAQVTGAIQPSNRGGNPQSIPTLFAEAKIQAYCTVTSSVMNVDICQHSLSSQLPL